MNEVGAAIERWRARGERVALATVVATRRSAPRPVGSKVAVSEHGELAGSVSGGCVEPDLAERARGVLACGRPELVSYGIADEVAWGVGLPCGGEIDVFLEPLERPVPEVEPDARAVSFTVVEGEPLGARLVVAEDGRREGDAIDGVEERAAELIRAGRNGVLEAGGRQVFYEVFGPPPRLLVFGAVDVAEALCRSARLLGWRTIVADARAGLATTERLASADELIVAWPDEVLAQVRPDHATAVVILTHEERFDVPALAGALATEAFYVGALGSRRTQARRRASLVESGVEEPELARIAGPAGLDVGASSPAEMALSILAEIVARRAGRAGGFLTETSASIHARD